MLEQSQDNGAKTDITYTYGNESDNEDKIILEDENAYHAVIDRESVQRTTTTRPRRVVITPLILKDYETDGQAWIYARKLLH